MSIDDFEERWRFRTGESAFASFGTGESTVCAGVKAALADGSFTLVLAVDAINDDLRRIVEYLNAITRDEVSIIAFEATRVSHGQVEILMPRAYGAELAEAKNRRRRWTHSWTQEEFLAAAGADGEQVAAAARLFLDEVRRAGFTVFNGTAANPTSSSASWAQATGRSACTATRSAPESDFTTSPTPAGLPSPRPARGHWSDSLEQSLTRIIQTFAPNSPLTQMSRPTPGCAPASWNPCASWSRTRVIRREPRAGSLCDTHH